MGVENATPLKKKVVEVSLQAENGPSGFDVGHMASENLTKVQPAFSYYTMFEF